MYQIIIAPKALKKLNKIFKLYQKEAFSEILQEIKEDPLIGKPLEQELTGRYAYRMSFYRIIYSINFKDKTVKVLDAGHRSTVYKKA